MTSFWEVQSQLKGGTPRRRARTAGPDEPAPTTADVLSVSEVTTRIRNVLLTGMPGTLLVRGEVSELTIAPSGHRYFCLKDDRTSLNCVMWRADSMGLKFEPKIGQELVAYGTIDVYSARGEYQLKCHRLEPVGQGTQELAFRQLVERLDREGLFAAERKRPFPPYPQRVAIVTSPQAAGYQDVLKVLRRFPHLRLFLYPVPVQGAGAAGQIAEALAHLSSRHEDIGGIDAVMLVRGGGSAEDLWAFNEEPVARALAAMGLPVITGIGHQTDRTIADMVADREAHTPTEAASVLIQRWKLAQDRLEQLAIVLRRDWRHGQRERVHHLKALARHETFRRPAEIAHRRRQRLDELGFALATAIRRLARGTGERLQATSRMLEARHPRQQAARDRQTVAGLASRLDLAVQRHHVAERVRLDALARHLAAVDPTAVLKRGYSLTLVERTGRVLASAGEVRPGDELLTRTADGEVRSTVGSPEQGKLFD